MSQTKDREPINYYMPLNARLENLTKTQLIEIIVKQMKEAENESKEHLRQLSVLSKRKRWWQL